MMIGTNPDPLLDRAGAPVSMAQFLLQKFREDMEENNRKADEPGSTVPRLDIERNMTQTNPFVVFMDHYLAENPPTTFQPLDRSYGVKLINGQSFVLGSAEQVQRGSMQPSHAAPVTGGAAMAEAYGEQAAADLTQQQGSQDLSKRV